MKLQLVGKWKLLFSPTRFCKYVNDHTLYKNSEGKYMLIGTTSEGDYKLLNENFFVRAEGNSLENEFVNEEMVFRSYPHGGPKISPHVFFDEDSSSYHLFFDTLGTIFHYISKDGIIWDQTKVAIRSFWIFLRDSHVIRHQNYYLMYLTDFGNKISVFKSLDLYTWNKLGTAFEVPKGQSRSFNSSCESPFVLKIKNGFLLFSTIVPDKLRREENLKYYNNTVVYYSKNPLKFTQEVGRLEAHAIEIMEDKGKYFMTTCGWKDFPKPLGVSGEGVFIREISIWP